MKKLLFILASFLAFSSNVAAQNCKLNIVPQPQTVNCLKGDFKLNQKTKIFASDETGRKTAGILNDLMMKNYGFKLEFTSSAPKNNVIKILPAASANGQNEAYRLKVAPQEIEISGSETGQFYALQSLTQMMPVALKGTTKIPAVEIDDAPRFGYRGMHLDVSRHYMPVSFVKKFIDLMSQYKFNQFHWHLTDDQGWRIEIKKYPKLTEIGSKRKESHTGSYSPVFKGDGVPVEGFYTQDEIRDVVAYAKARQINIIPEIELPGHASAALAAYPELGEGCKDNYEYKVQMTWGIFKEVFCPTDKTFGFLEDILTETIALFPDSPYIHIGGDEVLKDFWKESAFVQDLKKRENLKDEHEVQSYFIRRIEKFINSKGRKIIGWDEILEGGIAPNATIMSWRGEKGGIEAAKAKHDVIMTPNNFLYFDYGQGDPKFEPINIGNYVPLEKVYSYNPIPQALTAEEGKYIRGVQANLWTEYIKDGAKVEYMTMPRMLALAEVAWSPLEKKNFEDFRRRLNYQFQRLDKQSVNYRIPEPRGLQNVLLTEEDRATVKLESPVPGARIFYTLDGSEPTEKSEEYTKPVDVKMNPNERKEFRTIVMLPNGRKSVPYAATLLRRPYLQAVEVPNRKEGVNFAFYKKQMSSVNEMDTATPDEKGETKSVQLPQFEKKINLKEPFGVIFDGFINVPEDGIYEFQLESDDGSTLMIGDDLTVNNDGPQSMQAKTGVVPLKKGFHRLRMKFFQRGGDIGLNLRWGLKGTGLRRIYGNELFSSKN